MSALTLLAPGTYSDPVTKSFLDHYRKIVAGRYTPCPPGELQRLLAAPPFYVSRKIDGELWFFVNESDGMQLVSANGRILKGSHAIFEAGKSLSPGTILAGELHVAKVAGRERVGDVSNALSSSPEDLIFAAFDVLRCEEITWQDSSYATRLELMQSKLTTDAALHMIPVDVTESASEVHSLYQNYVEESKAEGVIVRCSDGRALKVKPELTIDCAILGFTTRPNAAGGEETRSLLLGLSSSDNESFIAVGTVGNMSEGMNRQELLETLQPLIRRSQYRQAASTGQLYQMVEPVTIVECRVMDVQVENSSGRPIKRQILRYETGEWRAIGTTTSGTLLNPTAVRLRGEKPNVIEGTRIEQIADYLLSEEGDTGDLPASEILTRRVWTKDTKGKTDVRKLLIWKTNKEQKDDTFSAYVVQWTDYSAGRKSPLTREVKPAATLESAETTAADLIESNVKKGWNETLS